MLHKMLLVLASLLTGCGPTVPYTPTVYRYHYVVQTPLPAPTPRNVDAPVVTPTPNADDATP